MEKVTLSASEQQIYAELFCACDRDSSGKVANTTANELFLASHLPIDVIHQITELCGAQRLGHFGRSQFYIALKLIAAAQIGLPLNPDCFNSGVEIPLPKFSRIQEGGVQCQYPVQPTTYAAPNSGRQDFILPQDSKTNPLSTSVHLPPPPAKGVCRVNSLNQHSAGLKLEAEDSSQLPCSQMSQVGEGGGSDSPGSSPSDVTTPTKLSSSSIIESPPPPTTNNTNSTHGRTDKSWAAFQKRTEGQDAQQLWDQFDEDRQLLGTEEESDRHSSDEEFDIWSITEEQREYYTNQFKSMQPDLRGLLSGVIAKDFFEKSKLPVQELSKIWQLSDVNKDGALSLEEFFTAMHLVVLRRNNIELPKVLPPSLVPKITQHQPEVITDVQISATHATADSPLRSPTEASSPHAKEWTRFNDSPTSSLSSPGSKPVNFDFQKSALEQDPKIFHPVPLRMSPDSQVVNDENEVTCPDNATTFEVLAEQKSPSKRLVNSESQEFKTGVLPQTAIQRPVPKKPAVPGPGAIPPPPQGPVVPLLPGMDEGVDGQVSVGAFPASSSTGSFPVQAQAALPQGPKKEPPPPPPPRPKKNHARSSSLDLNRLGAPPAVPPRMSPSTMTPKKLVGQKSEPDVVTLLTDQQTNFADFAQFSQEFSSSDTASSDVLQFKAGAFEVYKRPELSQSSKTTAGATTSLPANLPVKSPDTVISKEETALGEKWVDGVNEEKRTSLTITRSPAKVDKPSLRTAIRVQREQNTMLSRLNSELNQELSEVMEERIALEIQLEHLKPFST